MCMTARRLIVLFIISTTLLLAPPPAHTKTKTIHNDNKGLWDGDSSKHFKLTKDLEIGVKEGSENEILGRVYDIAVNSKDYIYILDNGFSRVQKYDSTGTYVQTIGREGEGPGEFSFPTAIAIDGFDNLYVIDRSSITIFDAGGKYVDKFKHGLNTGFIRSLKIDENSGIYVSALDVLEQKVIHKFSFDHERLFSFCDSYAIGQDIDLRVEQSFGGGAIDIDEDGIVYYTQMTPYEIRKFNPAGELLAKIYRENTFMTPPVAEEIEGGIRIKAPTAASSIVILSDKKFINVVKKPIVPGEPAETIIDLFDTGGRLLTSSLIKRNINVKCKDTAGRIYAADYDDYPSVVRYRVSFD